MVTASMKKIIWALGYMFIWVLQDFYYLLKYGGSFDNQLPIAFISLAILLIPLFLFKDDPISKGGKSLF